MSENKKQTFSMRVYWEVCADINIEATSKEEAIKIANDIPFPLGAETPVDDSFQIETITGEDGVTIVLEDE